MKMNNNLKYKNKFNTYQRFTDQNGLQQYKNGIVIDHMNGEELSKLQAKEIDAIVAYNKGEWESSGVYKTPHGFLELIAPVNPIEWHKPNKEEINKL